MNHAEQRIWLIKELQKEPSKLSQYLMPQDEQGQKELLRALMNVREPNPISEEFIKIQDEYLQEENASAGFVDIDDLEPVKSDSRLYLWQGDITRLKIDAIVNAANSQMLGCFQPLHSCIDNIIHSKAGIQLRLECYRIMKAQGHEEPTGRAKITSAYNLPCDYVIHTVGPIVQGPLTQEHEDLLASCYKSVLSIAEENNVGSVALCCISTGVFMFPNERAAEIAVAVVKDYLSNHDGIEKVVFNVFKDVDYNIYNELLNICGIL